MPRNGDIYMSKTIASFYELIALRKAIKIIKSGGVAVLEAEEQKALRKAHTCVNEMRSNQFDALFRHLEGIWPEEKEKQIILAELLGPNWYNRRYDQGKPKIEGAEEVVDFVENNLPGMLAAMHASDERMKKEQEEEEAAA